MPTEKAIVNVSQSVVSLSQGRLVPGGIFRVADHFRDPADVMRDVQLRKYMSSGYVQLQDIDFEALASAREAVKQADLDREADYARQAEAERARLAALEARQAEERLAREGAALVRQEAQQAAQAVQKAETLAPDDIAIETLFETSRKQRIALKQAEREKAAETAQAKGQTSEDRLVAPEDLLDMRGTPDPEPVVPAPLEPFPGPSAPFEPMLDAGVMDEIIGEVPAGLRETPVAPEPEFPGVEALTDQQLRKVAVAFEVKGAKKLRGRAALLAAVQALQLTEDQLRSILAEE